ncbi:hypothetical protein [Corynebacterium sp.]|uniref:hypothetical protein n=1 Tax=Corynebacterium sp. TaxID=1720 RepID=UPI0026DD8D7A|nr:hypothetical protein [Corynebacterium sp.]MDO5077092.1 hypothetical protein [Corynebacterium sp.]
MNHLRGAEGSGAGGHENELVLADDAFLTELARGVDPSDGTDELAGLLLDLKAEVDAPMPPAPLVNDAPTTAMRPIRDVPAAPTSQLEYEQEQYDDYNEYEEYEDAEVVDLSTRRPKRSFRQAFLHGVLGAAAATLAIAGSGIAIYNAGPGSPLWGAHVALFSDHAAVVELASTLEQADDSRSRGDVERALELLDQARTMAADIQAKRGSDTGPVTTVTVTQGPVATSTTPKSEEPEEPTTTMEPPPPVTVTATVTVVQQPAPIQQPTSQAPAPSGPENPNPSPPDPAQPPVEPGPPGETPGG